ncbi:MAG: hypothetical protein AABZ53_14505 [Planctomycetota bacterium]
MAITQATDGTGFKQDLQGLGDGLGTLRTDVKNLAHGAVDAARSGAAELRQGAQHAVEAAKEKFDGAKQAASEATDSLRGVVTRHPIASIGIAAGVGVLAGLILSRSRS